MGALGYYDPSDGFVGDVLQAFFQKFVPSTDWMGAGSRSTSLRGEDPVTVMGYSGHADGRERTAPGGRRGNIAVTLRSPVVSYPRHGSPLETSTTTSLGCDVSNLLAPSLNPVKFGSGLLDLFCGFCIHRGNNY